LDLQFEGPDGVAIFLAGGHRTILSQRRIQDFRRGGSSGGLGEAEAFSLIYTLILDFFEHDI